MHAWSLVINIFWWLTIQTTFKIDSISCNWLYIFKTISKQYCLNYYTKRKKWSSFTETYSVLWEPKTQIKLWYVPYQNALDILKNWYLDVLAALSQNLSNHNGRKYVLSLVKHIHGIHRNTLSVFYLFVWASYKKEKKKQYYTFNNSSTVQMLGKDHVLFKKRF